MSKGEQVIFAFAALAGIEALEGAVKCKIENGPLSKKGFNEQYRRGPEAAGQAIAAAIRAELSSVSCANSTGGKDE